MKILQKLSFRLFHKIKRVSKMLIHSHLFLCFIHYIGNVIPISFNEDLPDYRCCSLMLAWPVTVAERSKSCTVFARSEAGTVGSNPTQGMDV
jgi:hypothetical protein